MDLNKMYRDVQEVEVLDEGVYKAEIIEASVKRSKTSGYPMYHIKLQVEGGPELQAWIILPDANHPKQAWCIHNLKAFYTAIGYEYERLPKPRDTEAAQVFVGMGGHLNIEKKTNSRTHHEENGVDWIGTYNRMWEEQGG